MTSGTPTPVLNTPDQAVRDVIASIGAAWSAGDAQAFAALYSPDATVVLPGGVYLQGRSHIRAHAAAAFSGPLKGSTTVNSDVQVRPIAEDVAIATSLGGAKVAGAAEVSADQLRRATWVLSRRDGTWLIDSYSTCSLGAA